MPALRPKGAGEDEESGEPAEARFLSPQSSVLSPEFLTPPKGFGLTRCRVRSSARRRANLKATPGIFFCRFSEGLHGVTKLG